MPFGSEQQKVWQRKLCFNNNSLYIIFLMKSFIYKSIILLAIACVYLNTSQIQGQQALSKGTKGEEENVENKNENETAGELKESEIIDIADTIEDPEKRKKLIQQLRILAEVEANKDKPLKAEGADAEASTETVASHWLFAGLKTIWSRLSSPHEVDHLLRRCILTAILIGALVTVWILLKRKRLNKDNAPRWLRFPAGIAFLLIGGALFTWIWGLPLHKAFTNPAGREFLKSASTIVAIIIGGWVVWRILNHYITKHAFALQNRIKQNRRLQTLLPLFRNILRIFISIVVGMLIIAELGINIAPLLAGGGFAVLAIGFAAQSIIKDLLTGFMFLAEDAINIDDWVILGNYSGQVEGINIRHIRMRDIYGNVHIVPWGTVEGVTNQTKLFSYAVLEAGVAYRENIDEVIEVLKKVAAEMRDDEELKKDILSELQVLGVIELGNSSVVIRTRFKATPFKKWFLERNFRQRVKNRFDELGIEIPYPHTTLYFGENKQGTAPPARVQINDTGQEDENGTTPRDSSEHQPPANTQA